MKKLINFFLDFIEKKLYFFLSKNLYKISRFCINYENENGGIIANASIRLIYDELGDIHHIERMFDKHIVDGCIFLRKVNGKHNRTYNLFICERKKAKTIFMLSREDKESFELEFKN